jgi:hypothetical protein
MFLRTQKKQIKFLAIFVLFIMIPFFAFAEGENGLCEGPCDIFPTNFFGLNDGGSEAPEPSDPLEEYIPEECSDENLNPEGATAVEKREAEDACALAKAQNDLKTIRQTEDVDDAVKECQDEYQPDTLPTLGTGTYVPVKETGRLLDMATDISQFTKQSYEIDRKLCVYLKTIKRVQYAMEDLALIQEPAMRRMAATKVEEYKEALTGENGMIQKGYTRSGELVEPISEENPDPANAGGDPMYPQNLEDYVSDNRNEAAGKVYDEINQSQNIFKREVTAKLKIDETRLNRESYDSTITKEEYDKLVTGGKGMTSQKYWSTFTKMFDPTRPNNPGTAYFLTQQKMNQAKERSTNLALEEYSTGGGFLPSRKCVEYTLDGKFCNKWITETPGQIINQTTGAAMNSRLQQYLNPTMGTIGGDNGPNTGELETFISLIGMGASLFDFNKDKTNPDPDDGDNPAPDPVDPTSPPPTVSIIAENITGNFVGIKRKLTWKSTNAVRCAPNNDWIGTKAPSLLATIIKKDKLKNAIYKNSSLSFSLPIDFHLSWSNDDINYLENNFASTTNPEKTQIAHTWYILNPIMHNYYLKIADNVDNYTINIRPDFTNTNFPNAKNIVEQFKKYQGEHSSDPVYQRYKFTYDVISGTPNIKIELINPVYKITCLGLDGSGVSASTE